MTKNLIIYSRISLVEKDPDTGERDESKVIAQEERCRAFIEAQGDTVVGIVRENSTSAYREWSRKKFNALLRQAQAGEIAEGNATQVVVYGIGSDDPRQLGQPQMSEPMPMPETEAEMTAPAARSGARRTEEEQKVAFIPRFDNPMSVPESRGGMPAS